MTGETKLRTLRSRQISQKLVTSFDHNSNEELVDIASSNLSLFIPLSTPLHQSF
ncbi:hypothetical protein BY996DRAFT_6462418 [Phakopsora pachyrhizi]|nr:hypothetical protein BY996DRAFT_6462418 [Phakopsora pachyrhizi]